MRSSQESPGPSNILLTGNSGSGKTFAAATYSKHFPYDRVKELIALSDDPKKGSAAVIARLKDLPWVHLDDLYWVPFDVGALDGLRAFKISVPFLPFQEIAASNVELDRASGEARNLPIMPAILAKCAQTMREDLSSPEGKKVEAIINDTVTVLDVMIASWCDAKFKFPVNEITSMHRQWFGMQVGLKRVVVACAHLEALTDPVVVSNTDEAKKTAAEQKLRQDAARSATTGKLVAAMQRRARQLWEAHCSDQFACERRRDDAGRAVFALLTEAVSSTGVAARSRTEVLLDKREPVNLRAVMVKTGKLVA